MINWNYKLSPFLRQNISKNNNQSCYRLLVEASGRRLDRILSVVESNQGRLFREIHLIPALVVEVPQHSFREIATLNNVTRIWQDLTVHATLDKAVPGIGGTTAHQLGYTGKGVVAAVLDTGIDPHPDLTKPVNRILAWNDLINQEKAPYDDNGHGTHVAGIIAGNGGSSDGKYQGIAPDAWLVGIKILDQDGNGNLSDVIAGLEWCLAHQEVLNVRIINLSLGATPQGSCRSDPLCRAVSAAWNQGIVVCAAAGNEGPESGTISTPGINPKIITVGNLDDQETISPDDDRLNPTSSRGPTVDQVQKPDIVAPGTRINSLKNGGGYQSLSGTSMATPLVAGAIALILQKFPDYQPDRIKSLLLRKARDLGLGPNLQGAGVIDLENIFGKLTSKKPTGLEPSLNPNITNFMMKMLLGLLNNPNGNGQTSVNGSLLSSLVSLINTKPM